MTEAQRDPLEPPRHRLKKSAGGPLPTTTCVALTTTQGDRPGAERLDDPSRDLNWKNNKGYTFPSTSDSQQMGVASRTWFINDNFAQFAEASISPIDMHVKRCDSVSIMQQKLAAKEKAAKRNTCAIWHSAHVRNEPVCRPPLLPYRDDLMTMTRHPG